MENKNARRTQEAGSTLNDGGLKEKTRGEADETNSSDHKAYRRRKRRRWSLRRRWSTATRARKVKWLVGACSIFIVTLIWVIYIAGFVQNERSFRHEHRARIIFSRAPELESFGCNVTDAQLQMQQGSGRVWVQSPKPNEAVGAFIVGPGLHLIADKKIGDNTIDKLDPVTDETCRAKISPLVQGFALNSGEEKSIEIGKGAATLNFGSTSGMLSNDSLFQLYAPTCAYYFDEGGDQHATCMTFRFVVNGSYSFSCKETPITGTFQQTNFGYCEN